MMYKAQIHALPIVATPSPIEVGKHEFVGVAVNGVALAGLPLALNFDGCMGHTDTTHQYHYHMAPSCLFEKLGIPYPSDKYWWAKSNRSSYWPATATAPSPIVGWALDGYPIFGPYKANNELVTKADVDECNGMEVDGKYRYVMTPFPPFILSCFHGVPVVQVETKITDQTVACPMITNTYKTTGAVANNVCVEDDSSASVVAGSLFMTVLALF